MADFQCKTLHSAEGLVATQETSCPSIVLQMSLELMRMAGAGDTSVALLIAFSKQLRGGFCSNVLCKEGVVFPKEMPMDFRKEQARLCPS